MNHKIWQTNDTPLHPLIESYTVGNDHIIDQRLLGYDVQASKAHAAMLCSVGLLTKKELSELKKGLNKLYKLWQTGNFTIKKEQEDGHTAIEAYLVEQVGDAGKKIHTARSRNDQAMTMMRLYLKESLAQTADKTDRLTKTLQTSAEKAGDAEMPGYTHMQKAMPSTVACWLGAYAEAFTDAKQLVDSTLPIIDQNPLGSAAGFGVNMPIDRQHTTHALAFAKTQENPMYCGFSRGFFELIAVQALNPIMVLAGKLARDMLLFTTEEFGFFSLPDEYTTGSSIMPHKHNYDVFEIMRAKSQMFGAHTQQLQSLLSSIGSGYHRDLQLSKSVTIDAFDSAQETLDVLCLVFGKLKLHKKRLSEAITPEMHSVGQINELVGQGVPFRDAYIQVKKTLEEQRGKSG